MKWHVIWEISLVYRILCTSPNSEDMGREIKPSDMEAILPLGFTENQIVAYPTTSLENLGGPSLEGKNLKERITFLINYISEMVWGYSFSDLMVRESIREMFEKEIEENLKAISESIVKIYEKDKTFSEVIEMVYEKMFEFNERMRNRKMLKLGEVIIEKVEKDLEALERSLKNEKRKKEREDIIEPYVYIKLYGESFYDVKKWKKRVAVEKMVCEACRNLYSNLKKEQILGMEIDGNMKKFLKSRDILEEFPTNMYLEATIIDCEVFLNASKDYGKEVVEELVKQILLGKDGDEIDMEYVSKVKEVIEERKKREMIEERTRNEIERRKEEEMQRKEEEANRHAEELIRDEERSKGNARGKSQKKENKSSRGDKSGNRKSTRNKNLQTKVKREDGDKEAKVVEKDDKGSEVPVLEPYPAVHPYKIHERIWIWRKEADRIKEWWDSKYEMKWRNKSLKVMKEQKKRHDIREVVELFRSEYRDRFFITKEDSIHSRTSGKRYRSIGVARFWDKDKKAEELGVVEIGTYRNNDDEGEVIYHLLFKETSAERIKEIIDREFESENDMKIIYGGNVFDEMARDTDSEERWEEEEGKDKQKFVYPRGVRCSIIRRPPRKFTIEWRNPSNTQEVIKSLSMVPREEVI